MPTLNPRVNVTLPPGLDALVQRMATLQRVSKSHVIRELLESSEPLLRRAVDSMEAADRALHRLHEFTDGMEPSPEMESVWRDGRLVLAEVDLVGQAEVVTERRPRRGGRPRGAAGTGGARGDGVGSGVQNPPSSNRGVKSADKRGPAGTVTPLSVVPKGGI
jgi:hypothetical protein